MRHCDPSHSWFEAPRAELDRLAITAEVSGFSYTSHDRQTVYLEEDCDAPLYLQALNDEGRKFRLCDMHTDHDSAIRTLPRFRA
jgi:hypothetical protein